MSSVCEVVTSARAEPGFQPQKVLRTFWGPRKDTLREPNRERVVGRGEGGGSWENHGFPRVPNIRKVAAGERVGSVVRTETKEI
jgi:hypothetical protein